MGGSRWQPRLWSTICALPVFALFVGLGIWQLERLEWKRELIVQRTAAIAAEPLDLGDGPLADRDFVKLRIGGRFRHELEIHLVAPPRRGRSGYHVLTPLQPADGGSAILVDRGWIPEHLKGPDARRDGQVSGRRTVVGIARVPPQPNWFTPDNRSQSNVWYWVDLETIERLRGVDLRPFVVEADATPNPGGHPLGGQTRFELPNAHLGYAMTWFGLAAGLVAVYIAFHWRKRG